MDTVTVRQPLDMGPNVLRLVGGVPGKRARKRDAISGKLNQGMLTVASFRGERACTHPTRHRRSFKHNKRKTQQRGQEAANGDSTARC